MDYTFTEFCKACVNYWYSLEDEDDIEECTVYFNEAEESFLSIKDRAALWNDSSRMQVNRKVQKGEKIRPEDSVSQTESHSSHRSLSSTGSKG